MEDWRGVFYPDHLAHSQWLTYYAGKFPAVEVDSTFYHAPSESMVKGWYDRTPDDFRFCLKAPRQITHEFGMGEPEAELKVFLEVISHLKKKLGMVLLSFPPAFHAHPHGKWLHLFLQELPTEIKFAIEFRDDSWDAPRFDELLRKHGVTRVWSDKGAPGNLRAFHHLGQTSRSAYVRLLGETSAQFDAAGHPLHVYSSLMWPRQNDLDAWAARLGYMEELDEIYIFASNYYEGLATETAERLAERMKLPIEQRAQDWHRHLSSDASQRDFFE